MDELKNDSENLIQFHSIKKRIRELLNGAPLDEGETQELAGLQKLAADVERRSSFSGLALINENYFNEYVYGIINERFGDAGISPDDWPYSHITLDYAAAAEELKLKYHVVMLDDVKFYYH